MSQLSGNPVVLAIGSERHIFIIKDNTLIHLKSKTELFTFENNRNLCGSDKLAVRARLQELIKAEGADAINDRLRGEHNA